MDPGGGHVLFNENLAPQSSIKLNQAQSSSIKLNQAQSGFSLIEVMIAIAISMGVMYGLASVIIFNARATKSTELSGEFNLLVSTIQTIINKEASCQALFNGINFTATTAGEIKPVISASPLMFHGSEIAKEGSPATGLKVTKIVFDKIIDNTLPDVTISGITSKHYLANLHLETEKMITGGAIGGNQLSANFPVSLLVSANKVTGCYGEGTVAENPSKTCTTIGGAYANGACTFPTVVTPSTASCTANNLGAFRYSKATDLVEYCSSTGWRTVGGVATPGQCNNAVSGGCTAGSIISDNSQVSCGTTRYWKCSGDNGGATSAQCSYANAACSAGQCGSSVGSCNVGTPTGDNAQSSCNTSRTWYCTAAGGSSGLCAVYNGNCPAQAAAVDCKGEWSTCAKPCGPENQTFVVRQFAQNGGATCSPYTDGMSRDCGNPSCPPVPFTWYASELSPCSNHCTSKLTAAQKTKTFQTRTTVQCQQGTTVVLDANCDKNTKPALKVTGCTDDSECPVNCSGKYEDCDAPPKNDSSCATAGTRSYTIYTYPEYGGKACPAASIACTIKRPGYYCPAGYTWSTVCSKYGGGSPNTGGRTDTNVLCVTGTSTSKAKECTNVKFIYDYFTLSSPAAYQACP
jgi:hypothetical protein